MVDPVPPESVALRSRLVNATPVVVLPLFMICIANDVAEPTVAVVGVTAPVPAGAKSMKGAALVTNDMLLAVYPVPTELVAYPV